MSSRILRLFTVKGAQEALAGLAAAIAIAGVSLAVTNFSLVEKEQTAATSDLSSAQIAELHRVLARQNSQIEALNRYVEAASNSTPDQNRKTDAAILAKLRSDINILSQRQNAIEQIILVSPAKALAIPMLKRDIEAVKSSTDNSIKSFENGNDRLYDLNKYVVLTIFASIVLLAISNFIKPKSP